MEAFHLLSFTQSRHQWPNMGHFDNHLLHNFALTLVTGQVVMARFKASSKTRQGIGIAQMRRYGGYAGTTQQIVVSGAFKQYLSHKTCHICVSFNHSLNIL